MFKKVCSALAIGALLLAAGCSSGGSDEPGSTDTGTNNGGTTSTVKTDKGVSDSQINVGILTDYSGPIAAAATAGSVGMRVYFDKINDQGGICGRDINFIKGDTQYNAQKTVQAFRGMENDVAMIGQVVGTSGLMAIKDSLAKDDIATISSSVNSIAMQLEDVYVVLPLFEIEMINGVAWAADKAGVSESNPVTVATVTPNGELGDSYAGAVKFVADNTPGLKVVKNVKYTTGDTDFTAPVSELKDAGADITALGTDPAATAAVIGQAAQLGYKPTWVSNSGAWTAGIAKPLSGLLDNYYISGGYGTLDDTSEGITNLKAAVAKYAPDQKPDNFLVGGWLEAQVVVAVLEKACDNGDLTRQGINDAFKNLEVGFHGELADIDIGNGDEPVSYATRMNVVGKDGVQKPITEFEPTDLAKEWAKDQGF